MKYTENIVKEDRGFQSENKDLSQTVKKVYRVPLGIIVKERHPLVNVLITK